MKANLNKTKRKDERTAWLFLLPSLGGVALFSLLPLLETVRRSFTDAAGKSYVGLANYQSVAHSAAFVLAAKNTLRFIAACLPLLLCGSLAAALLLRSRLIKKSGAASALRSAILLPMAIPVAGVVLLWRLLFAKNGLANALLAALGAGSIDFMGSGAAFGVLVFTYIWKNLGYGSVLWGTGLDAVPAELYEAAAVDGAGAVKAFFFITLPNIIPTVFLTALMALLNCFKVFREAYLVAGAYPHESIYQLQHLFNNWFAALDLPRLCAAAVLVLLALSAMIFAVLYFVEGRGGSK